MSGLFASPLMLLWGIAVAVPLLIHLLLRRRHLEVPWAAMRLIETAVRRHARPFRLWQWILLALRMLAVSLLALAAAQPQGCLETQRRSDVIGCLKVLVLDASYSMQTVAKSGRSLWQQAVAEAVETCRQAGSRDGFIVVLLSNPPTAPLAQPSVDRQATEQLLLGLKPTHGTADVIATLQFLKSILAEPDNIPSKFRSVDVIIWSDLQQNTWKSLVEQPDQPFLRELNLLASITIKRIELAATPTNRSVQSIQTSQLLLSDQPIAAVAEVVNQTNTVAEQMAVSLSVDDHVQRTELITLGPDQDSKVQFQIRVAEGNHVISIESAKDDLEPDNHRWAVMKLRDHYRVAVIADDREAGVLFATAASPDPQDRALDIVVGDQTLLNSSSLDWDVVVLCDLASFNASLIQFLAQLHRDGTGLIVWTGPRTIASEFNRKLWEQPSPPLVPAKLQQPIDFGGYGINPEEYQHPIVAPFASFPNSGLLNVPLFRYWTLADERLTDVRVALSSNRGDPLLITVAPAEGGTTALLTLPADLQEIDGSPWTGLAAWPSFPPLVRGLIEWSIERIEQPLLVGQTIRRRLKPVDLRQTIDLLLPSGTAVMVPVRKTPIGTSWQFAGTELPGIYRYGDVNHQEFIAVNVDVKEGELEYFDANDVQKLFPVNSETRLYRPVAPQASTIKSQLHRYLLGIMLLVLIAEMIVGRWMQRSFG